MILARTIEALRQRWPLLVRMFVVVLVLLVIIDAVPFLVDKEKAHTAMESIPVSGPFSVFQLCVDRLRFQVSGENRPAAAGGFLR
ncbi:MAG: hypothetical protein R2864_12390 [Syntrophotaleaceae bacterium]